MTDSRSDLSVLAKTIGRPHAISLRQLPEVLTSVAAHKPALAQQIIAPPPSPSHVPLRVPDTPPAPLPPVPDAHALRVPKSLVPSAPPAKPLRVDESPSPTEPVTPPATYANSSGPAGKCRRKQTRLRSQRLAARNARLPIHLAATNLADHFTQLHPAAHHRAICFTYLYSPAADPSQNYFACLDDDDNHIHSPSSSPLGSLDPAGEGVLESQDPEVEQHSSSTDGPTTNGPATPEPATEATSHD
jgi:hypothetical protein